MSKPKMTTEEFVQRSREVQRWQYDYSKVQYQKHNEPVEIICPQHGSFFQQPQVHLRGVGCRKCSTQSQTKPVDLFIQQASAIHQNKYNYSRVKYLNVKTEVEIVCPEHGSFFKTPTMHLSRGVGCPKCSSKRPVLDTTTFIVRATSIHQDRYDYSKVKYKNDTTKVEIVCKQHGSFFQDPGHHVGKKQGCPLCKHEAARLRGVGGYNLETIPETQTGMLYCVLLTTQDDEYVKVGITKNDQYSRLCNYGAQITTLREKTGSLRQMYVYEQEILQRLKHLRYHFRPKNNHAKSHGWTEMFAIDHLQEVIDVVDVVISNHP